MFGRLFGKKKEQKEQEAPQSPTSEYKFTWYEPGPDNPFNKRILDCRSLTQTMLATTSDASVAVSFNDQRESIGQELVSSEFANATILEVDLSYPHNGSKMESAAYKAQCMEDKWDLYVWNDIFYFARSWTGQVIYKAHIKPVENNFVIHKIECQLEKDDAEERSLVINNVHFLLMTLAYGRIYPHKVPKGLEADFDIALYSFSRFGRNCWYATYEDILDTTVTLKEK